MFSSAVLDRLTRVHPVVPPLLFAPAIAVTFALGQEGVAAPSVVALLIAGYVAWSLTEYWMHRVIFHFEPEQGIGARLHWMIHGVHHDHPNDPMRLVMPPSVSVPLALAFYGLFHLTVGGQYADLVACGFLAGYLAYDMTHYALHHRTPSTRVGRFFYEVHMRHHFQDETRGYGVSVPFMDYVFGTQVRRRRR